MILQQIKIRVEITDNSGADEVKFLKILEPETDRNYLLPGDIIQIAVMKLTEEQGVGSDHPKMKRGGSFRALVLRAEGIEEETEDWYIKARNNSICLLGDKNKPLCTKITGFISPFVSKHYPEIHAMSQGFI
jgi:ribosomal protein L14